MQNKKGMGGVLGYVLTDACGYLSRGRGVKEIMFDAGGYFKTLNPLCRLVSIVELTILFFYLGGVGVHGLT